MDKLTFVSSDADYNRYDYHIEWVVSDACQLKCSYCFRKTYPILPTSLDLVVNTVKQLNSLSIHKRVKVILTGGEPLLFPHFNTIVDTLNPEIGLDLNTNGFLLTEQTDFERFTLVSVSWHSEYFDGLFKKLPTLKAINNLGKLNVNIVVNHENISVAKQIQKICEDEMLSYSLVTDIYETESLDLDTSRDNNDRAFRLSYSDRVYLKSIHDIAQAVKRNNCFQFSKCTNNFITINPDHTVNYACRIKPIANIESLIASNNEVICTQPVCVDLYQFADTSKVIWRKDKIKALLG